MKTHFITTEIKFQESPIQLRQLIEDQLRCAGEPLRWAITSVDLQRQIATVEAVVTLDSDTPISV